MNPFNYISEQFADTRILRYEIPGFEKLPLQEKILVYYLHEAALSGRDIYWDQNYRFNLTIRKMLEEILTHYNGNRKTPEFDAFITYAKRVFVANGIHHQYSTRKLVPGFLEQYFIELVNNSPDGRFPVKGNEEINDLLQIIVPIIFDPDIDPIQVNLNPDADMALESANNFYHGVTQDEVINFYQLLNDPENSRPVSWGLNSQLARLGDQVTERVWRIGGMYSKAIIQIVHWLQRSLAVAQNDHQRMILARLIEFYETGDLEIFDQYNILWVQDTISNVDFTNGFIEVYGDPFGLRGAYQSMVSITDHESADRVRRISANAQWFEDHMPFSDEFKKPKVTGISARAIHIAAVAGDNSPTPPLGVNLPNSDWIRREYGSKSVTITNVAMAHHHANMQSGITAEFACNEEEIELARRYGFLANNLHTDLHEIIGHGSGRLREGVAEMSLTLRNYASAIEETRADLAALYYIMDPRLVELGIMPDLGVGIAQYNHYIKNGLMQQLYRIEPGQNIEQTHMRNRQIIASKAMETGLKDNVIEKVTMNGKTCIRINNHLKLREIFGAMLAEVQRIKSEGDYDAARELVETYGVQADQELLLEVHSRYNALGTPPYTAFINPVFIPVVRNDRIVDIKVEYPESFLEQMLYYGRTYSFLPVIN